MIKNDMAERDTAIFEDSISLVFEKIKQIFSEKKSGKVVYCINGKFEDSNLLIEGIQILSNVGDKPIQRKFVEKLNKKLLEEGIEPSSSHLDNLEWVISMDWMM